MKKRKIEDLNSLFENLDLRETKDASTQTSEKLYTSAEIYEMYKLLINDESKMINCFKSSDWVY